MCQAVVMVVAEHFVDSLSRAIQLLREKLGIGEAGDSGVLTTFGNVYVAAQSYIASASASRPRSVLSNLDSENPTVPLV